MTRIDRALADARAVIGGDCAQLDAQLLLAQVLGRSRTWLFARADDEIAPAALDAFSVLVEQRAAGVPIAYLLGERDFWSLSLRVSPAVLIPRPETELLVELALARIATGAAAHVADLGTGSGAVALALASERPQAHIVATDASAAALEVARANAQRLGLANVEFALGDWCAPLAGRSFDVIASNPPYIAAADAHLGQGDLRFEPLSALASGRDGLDAIRAIVAAAPGCLNRGGWLLFEHGAEQGAAVRDLLEQRGFSSVETARDLEQRERVTLGCWRADGDSAR